MNRPLLITAGIMLLLFMVGLWVYLIAYGAPEKPREVFSNLGILSPASDVEVRTIDPSAETNPGVQIALGGSDLQQLTTRAVAGFAFLSEEGNALRYVERGTGYIFELDLALGTEKQVSLTTVPQTREAHFSPNGSAVVLTADEGYGHTSVLGTFTPENELKLVSLPAGAENIAFENSDTLYFTLEDTDSSAGYAFDLDTLKQSSIVALPFPNARMLWGARIDEMFVFPKPSAFLEGALYRVAKGGLSPVSASQKGLTAFGEGEIAIVSTLEGDTYASSAYLDGVQEPLGLLMIPEKCAFNPVQTTEVWCASALEVQGEGALDDWYKGGITYGDHLWSTDMGSLTSAYGADLTELSGRTIDVDGMEINASGDLMLMRNKIDGTLWLYRMRAGEPQ